jgi:hypothetical protein
VPLTVGTRAGPYETQANVDPKVASPAEIMRARAKAVGDQIEGLTGGLEAK